MSFVVTILGEGMDHKMIVENREDYNVLQALINKMFAISAKSAHNKDYTNSEGKS